MAVFLIAFESVSGNFSERFMNAGKQAKRPEAINRALAKRKGAVSKFIARNYRHFNSAALLDAAKLETLQVVQDQGSGVRESVP